MVMSNRKEEKLISRAPVLMGTLRMTKPLISNKVWQQVRGEILESGENISATLRSDRFWEMLIAQGLSITLLKTVSEILGVSPQTRKRIFGR